MGISLRRKPESNRLVRMVLEQHGISADAIEHVVMSHVDPTTIGALNDFPNASLHALPCAPLDQWLAPRGPAPPQFANAPKYLPPRGQPSSIHGFRVHRLAIDELDAHLVELPGPAPGHAGLLLRDAPGLVLYVGFALVSLEHFNAPTQPRAWTDWKQILADTAPFDALLTRTHLRQLALHPPGTLTLIAGRGSPAHLCVGPGPHPTIGWL
jgi:glyoxylase-like metal-dependent hydrolase (beta-lactamase superfamily II)